MEIKGSLTEANLREAFERESQANRLFLYFAQKADAEGFPDIASVFRSTAEGETGHAHGLLEYLEPCGAPASGLPFGCTADNLRAAIEGERADGEDRYPRMAQVAREEGFDDIAEWFESLAGAEQSHAERFRAALRRIEPGGVRGR
jgi:rubrerythrin